MSPIDLLAPVLVGGAITFLAALIIGGVLAHRALRRDLAQTGEEGRD